MFRRNQQNQFFDPNNQHLQLPAQQRARRFAFRWIHVWVLLAIIGVAWFVNQVQSSIAWERVMEALGVHNKSRYTQLFCLGIVVTTICAICRVLKRDQK